MGLSPIRPGPAARRPHTVRPGNTSARPNTRGRSNPESSPTDPAARDAELATLEAVLFLADEPLSAKQLAEAAGFAHSADVARLLGQLRELLDATGSPFNVCEIAGGYQLLTNARYQPWLLRLRRTAHDSRLSPPVLETLAVIAHKQPIMKAEVEAIRGVSCSEALKLLAERGLIRVGGRHESLGRPQLYITTKKFLQLFGLNSLDDLSQTDGFSAAK